MVSISGAIILCQAHALPSLYNRLLDKASEPPKGAKPSSNTLVLTPPTGHTPSTSHMSSFTGHTPSTDHTSSTGHTPAAEHIPDVQKPISSSTDFSAGGTTSEEPLASRYAFVCAVVFF